MICTLHYFSNYKFWNTPLRVLDKKLCIRIVVVQTEKPIKMNYVYHDIRKREHISK